MTGTRAPAGTGGPTRGVITQDTWKGSIWEPWTQNLYVYVHNNPVNFVDPTGHREAEFAIAGRELQEKVGTLAPWLQRNWQVFKTTWGNRIPDFLSKEYLVEVKNVAYQYLSRQLRGMMEVAKETQRTFVLIIREGTRLSEPLMREIKDVGGKIWVATEAGLVEYAEYMAAVGADVSSFVGVLIIPQDLLEEEYIPDYET